MLMVLRYYCKHTGLYLLMGRYGPLNLRRTPRMLPVAHRQRASAKALG